jgi:arginine deiminase
MYWPARRRESLNMLTIYRYHPMFQDAGFEFWYPEQSYDGSFNIQDFGRSSLEGGDVQPIGKGTVAIGMSERSQARMIEMVAKSLFVKGGAERVVAAGMSCPSATGRS